MSAENQVIGSYRLVRPLGAGGIGRVFEGVHERIRRRVAIKFLNPEFATDQEILRRFFNEAVAANVVEHPGLVDVFDFGTAPDGSPYLVMEFLNGASIRQRLGQVGRLPLREVLRLSSQIADVLAIAHARGVIHRDLKPENVMIVPDNAVIGLQRVKVLDFGIAKVAAGHQTASGGTVIQTREGTAMGTPHYMAPEQWTNAAKVDDRTDVYALGVMVYEMLTGAPPFDEPDIQVLMARHLFAPPSPLRALVPGVPQALHDLVHRMLDKTRGGRPAISEVASELNAMLDTLHGEELRRQERRAAPTVIKRNIGRGARGVAVGAGVLLAVLALIAAVVLLR